MPAIQRNRAHTPRRGLLAYRVHDVRRFANDSEK
jgi:hypothetical protein